MDIVSTLFISFIFILINWAGIVFIEAVVGLVMFGNSSAPLQPTLWFLMIIFGFGPSLTQFFILKSKFPYKIYLFVPWIVFSWATGNLLSVMFGGMSFTFNGNVSTYIYGFFSFWKFLIFGTYT